MSLVPVAIVTGASRGIGRAVALGLAREGYKTLLVARDLKRLEKVAEEIGRVLPSHVMDQAQPECIQLDLTEVDNIGPVVASIEQRLGRIDVLFNNAGLSITGTLDLESAVLDRLYALNLRAPFELMRSVVPVMRKRGSGYIFNLSSRNGKIAVAGLGAYSSSKFGLIGLSESVYRELAKTGIKVTALCPGWVNTDMASGEGCHHLPERMIQPDHLASTVLWLLSLGPEVSIMELMMECTDDVERRGTGELYAAFGGRSGSTEE